MKIDYTQEILKMLNEINSELRLESIYIITKKNFEKEKSKDRK